MPQAPPQEVFYEQPMELPAQPQDEVQNLYADTMREDKVTNLLSQIDPDNLLSDIEHRIRGYRKDNTAEGGWKKINEKTQEINEELVANVMSFLGSILNQNTSMSNFSNNEINAIMVNVVEHLADDLDVNGAKYGLVGNYTEMTRIGDMVSMIVFTVLKRSQNGMEARRIFSSLRISESLNQGPKKKGIMDSLKPW